MCVCVCVVQGASALGMITINWRLLGRAARQRVGRLASEAGFVSEAGSTSDKVTHNTHTHTHTHTHSLTHTTPCYVHHNLSSVCIIE